MSCKGSYQLFTGLMIVSLSAANNRRSTPPRKYAPSTFLAPPVEGMVWIHLGESSVAQSTQSLRTRGLSIVSASMAFGIDKSEVTNKIFLGRHFGCVSILRYARSP